MKDKSTFSRLVVKFQDSLKISYPEDSALMNSTIRACVPDFETIFKIFPGISIKNLFPSVKPERVTDLINQARKSDTTYRAPDLLHYFAIDCPGGIRIVELLQMLTQNKSVELAYVETSCYTPPGNHTNFDFSCSGQEYLNPAPEGIDAKYAWAFPGGDGSGGVKFIDIEKGWILNHEAINVSTLPNTGINRYYHAEHGAGVLGIILLQANEEGAIGIVPKAKAYVISQYRPDGSLNTADAILAAIDYLDFGDVLLIEAQALDSTGSGILWPVEIQDAIFGAIRLATAMGIIVVEAGGNGNLNGTEGCDLKEFCCRGKKLFDLKSVDCRNSGAILVAASSMRAPHKRMYFSNFGDRIDCFASGESVLTAGNYPNTSGFVINTYTGEFGGTSSAAAIVAGVALSVQNILDVNDCKKLSPFEMCQILSNVNFGTQSVNGRLIDKIGVMPDLKKIIDLAIGVGSLTEIKLRQYSET
jgi:Subtilase family